MDRVMMIPMRVDISPALNFSIQTPHVLCFGVDTKIVAVEGEPYTGDYVVTPRAHDQTVLPTKRKQMLDDVTVLEVPYWETSNESGVTAYIAQEV